MAYPVGSGLSQNFQILLTDIFLVFFTLQFPLFFYVIIKCGEDIRNISFLWIPITISILLGGLLATNLYQETSDLLWIALMLIAVEILLIYMFFLNTNYVLKLHVPFAVFNILAGIATGLLTIEAMRL